MRCLEPPLTTMSCKRKELTIFERGEIIGAWKCGISERKIAEALNCPSCTIHKVISTYKIHGDETLFRSCMRILLILLPHMYAKKLYLIIFMNKVFIVEWE